ncbi:hypothetical protein JRC04_04860 [Mycolicibacterium sp. S2-37]|uniref:phage tail fiber protein n=1 Tax=Mycolicibacterium sp. S2-37 TaxID=2810297 RepID=UPI001A948293|nr:hypothetical protein [Mycolicibacterium sp. S2-37]MBO0676790.1 hypothetical protein [Mycolicibacterium sp. S2-37]
MALSNAAMTLAANALRSGITHAQLHSAVAGGAGTSNVTSAARQAVTWAAASGDGDFGLASALNFTGGAASGAVYSVTLWSASTSGTFYGEFPLTGDNTFNAAGEYTVSSLNLNGSAS